MSSLGMGDNLNTLGDEGIINLSKLLINKLLVKEEKLVVEAKLNESLLMPIVLEVIRETINKEN